MIVIRYPGLPAEGVIQWERAELPFVEGQHLDAYLGIEFIKLEIVVSSAIGALDAEHYALHIPADGDEIHVIPKMGGKNKSLIAGILGAIAGALVIYATGGAATPGVLAYLQGAFVGYSLATTVVALLAKRIKAGDKTGSTYVWDGITNADQPGVADPVVMGDMRTGGVRVSAFMRLGMFFDATATPPTTRTGERGNILLYVSKDRIESIDDVRVNNTPISNFPGASYAYTKGEDPEQWYGSLSGNIDSITSVGLLATAHLLAHGFTTGQIITISGATEDTFNGTVAVTVIDPDSFSYPFAGANTSPAEGNITWSASGAPVPRPAGFDAIANTFSTTTEITTTPFIYTTQPSFLCDAVELIVAFPTGLFHSTKSGDRDNTSRYKIRYRQLGSSIWLNCASTGCDPATGIRTIKRTDRAPYFEAVRIDHLTPARYEIELTFVSADNTDATKDAWKPFLTGVTEEQQNMAPKPGKALIAVQALAIEALNGSLEGTVIDCRCKGIWVPWHDGTSWQPATWIGPDPTAPVGRNPAWLVVQALRNRSVADGSGKITYRAWGLGDDIPDTNIYVPSWRTFAAKCAQQVTVTPHDELGNPTGAPYTQPKHSLDIVLNQQRPALDMIAELLATARAARMMDGNGSQWGVFYDDNDDPTQLFTMGNIVAGSLNIHRDFSARTNTYDVTHLDRDNDFNQSTREVANAHLVETLKKPVKRDSLSMVGVTSWPNVFREASFNLRKIEATGKIIEFDASTDAILVKTGQVFNFQHERPQWGFGGRVRDGANTTSSVITGTLATQSGSNIFIQNTNGQTLLDLGVRTWEVRVRFKDGSAEPGELKTVAGASISVDGYLVLTTTTPFSQAPSYYDLVAFGPVGKSVKPWRCVAITRSGPGRRHLTGVEFNSSIYPDDGIVQIPDYSSLPKYGALPPPIDSVVAFEDLTANNDNSTKSTVKLQWARPKITSGFGFYEGATIEVSFDGTTYQPLDSVRNTEEYRWSNAPQEVQLWFRVTPTGVGGVNRNGAAVTGPLICHGKIGQILQDGDDRNADLLAETFDGISMPVGMTFTGFGTPVLSNGKVTLVTTAFAPVIGWNIGPWLQSNADTSGVIARNLTFAMIRMRVNAPSGGTAVTSIPVQLFDSGFGFGSTFPIIDDGGWHQYRVPFANGNPDATNIFVAGSGAGVSWTFLSGMLPIGTTIEVTGLSILAPSADIDLGVSADRWQRTRNQFDKDPTGFGFRLLAPLRQLDDLGNIMVVTQNGATWVSADGNTWYPVKRARQIHVANIFNGQAFNWDTVYPPTGGAAGLDPAAPKPIATNKVKLFLQAANGVANSAYLYCEATNVNDSGFTLRAIAFAGGSPGVYEDHPATFWPESASSKSSLSEEAAHGPSDASSSNAWYDFAGRGLPGAGVYYRVVAYVDITMPTVKKGDGTPYWVKVTLGAYIGSPDVGGSPVTPNTVDPPKIFVGSPVICEGITARLVTDGQTYRVPIVLGLTSGVNMSTQILKLDWYATALETNAGVGAKPTLMQLMGVETHYMTSASYTGAGSQNFVLTEMEDF